MVLVGRRDAILAELDGSADVAGQIEIEHCDQVVGMDESPAEAFRRKPDSSIARTVKLVKEGACQGAISAGNTGAMVASSMLLLKSLEGVSRAGICVSFPTPQGPCTVVDVGANPACKPVNLLQYGFMASVFAENVFEIDRPSVGLLNIGSEPNKGNSLVREAHDLLAETPLNFIGNIEGDAVHKGGADVIVCEGFIGNVVLKTCEGLAEVLIGAAKEELAKALGADVGRCREALANLAARNDYAAYGGAPLLGVDGVAIISHGRSNARAISNAIRVASQIVGHHVNDKIVEAIAGSRTNASSF